MHARRLRQLLLGFLLAAWAVAALAVDVGDKAPEFALAATTAKEIKLADFAGKQNVVVWFYIGAFTNT
jgi:peroxiredoxin Q/BCP